jgi:hypothetical protein
MAKDKNTYAKHQRESLKRQKAEAKQERRRKRKATADDLGSSVIGSSVATSDQPGLPE